MQNKQELVVKFDTTKVLKPLSQQDLDVLTPEAYLNSLPVEQIGLVFSQLDKIEKFFAGVRKIIEKEVKDGASVPGLDVAWKEGKVSEGFVASDEKVAEKLISMGYSKDVIYKAPSLISYTDIKKMVKTSGIKELKDAGLVGSVQAEPKKVVVYVGDLQEVDLEEKVGE